MFGVQDGGWCASGPRARYTFAKYGRSRRCRNGKGGPWANDVYRISGTCFPRSCYPVLHSGVDYLSLNCSIFYFVFSYIFFLGLQFANSNKVSVPQICFVFFVYTFFLRVIQEDARSKLPKDIAVCSLSSIEDALTTSAQEIVADSLGATPALTESGGVIAGEERDVRIATIFLFLVKPLLASNDFSK